jgi:hypothetical protein
MSMAVMVVVFIGIVGLLLWWNAALRSRRVTELQEFAAHGKFTWSERDASWASPYTGHFRFFTHGYNPRFQDFLQRTTGDRSVCVFQFSYITGSGKSRTSHIQSVVLMVSSKMNLPSFMLEPENILHKIGEFFGGGDIDFPESPVFSSKYLFKGTELEWITSLFSPEVRAFFEQNLGWSLEGIGDALIAFHHGRLWPVREIMQLVHTGEHITQMFKD